MAQDYHSAQRTWQSRFDTRRLADRLADATSKHISDAHRGFIEARDMFFIATADRSGSPQCSHKGGAPGFVRVIDDRTLACPSYDGNGMYLTAGTVDANPRVGLLFMDLETGTRLRVNGVASIATDDPLTSSWPKAQFVVRVRVDAVFANCRRYGHSYQLVERSRFVPVADEEPPVPDWKLDPWFDGTLSADDPARDPDHPSAPAIPQF